MVSREKVKIMFDLAVYEKEEGHHNNRINSYFKMDYLSKGLLGSFFAYTLCYFLFFVIVVMCNFDEVITNPNITEIVAPFKPYLYYYIFGLIIYELITIIVANKKYNLAKRSRKLETSKLRRLEKIYEIEEKSRQLAGEVK